MLHGCAGVWALPYPVVFLVLGAPVLTVVASACFSAVLKQYELPGEAEMFSSSSASEES